MGGSGRYVRLYIAILAEWCEEWSVKVNVEKCGVMHMRRKDAKRADERFQVGGEEIKVVEEYKYLGCVVDEYLSNVRMVGCDWSKDTPTSGSPAHKAANSS